MGAGGANRALRDLRTLHAAGTLGALGDARLIERFLELEGSDREDAFAILVQRHGRSVAGVCRRMLAGPADADDAFQAVFLVLARKAGSLRRVDDLGPWLRAVAVRVAREARRRSSRLRRREGGTLADQPAAAGADPDLFELRALLDEELQRLPRRYREPLWLCELEGATRRDAARRLGIPEGTLSTRLARGRVMLRNRLTRRGVAVGALGAVFPAPAKAGSLGALADASARLALKFAARDAGAGTVPAAVASLAEGVLQMIQAARLKSAMLATSALVAACLTAGLVVGRASPPADTPPKVAAQAAEPSKKDKPREPLQARGVVVDETGNPVAGAEVRLDPYSPVENRDVTDSNGAFAIAVRGASLSFRAILVRVDDGRKVGLFRHDVNLSRAEGEAPVRIVVKPSRDVTVHVAGADKAPIEGAVVEAVAEQYAVAHAATGADGTAKLSLPIDSQISSIVAKKEGIGFDYGEFNGRGIARGGAAAEDLPGSVALTLESPRVARIKAVDVDGKPLAGVDFRVWMLKKEGRRSAVNAFSRLNVATTDADGIATFDWLPPSEDLLQFWPGDEKYVRRRVSVEAGQTEPVVTTLFRKETIRGRVVMPDGSPAKDVKISALGTGQGSDNGRGTARTDDDGKYEMSVAPNEAYAVHVDEVDQNDWTAPSRLDVVIRPGKPVDGVDFQLAKGTMVKGTVTVGDDRRPAAGEYIGLRESGPHAPEDLRAKGDRFARQVYRQISAKTDAEGRYAIRVAPGTYDLTGPARTENENETITVTDQPEIVRDFHMPRPERGTLSGRVIAALDGKPIAEALVEIVSANRKSYPSTVTADGEGRFQASRFLDKTYLCARSPDGSLGALVEIGVNDPEVVIALSPTATATGMLLDERGKPAVKQQLEWGRRVHVDAEQTISMLVFAPKVVTDDQGRFTLPALVVGQKYDIAVQREDRLPMAGVAEPQTPGPMDLGTLQIGAYKGDEKAANSSFRPNAPDAGAVAPEIDATTLDGKPLALRDFAGKYLLLDFWATWCGPCLGEIPNLQDVYDAFGKDERFAILSLSVDEKIDEPRKFQETRKLPWNQGFLSGGLHGEKPGAYGVRAIPAFVLVGPDGKIVARGMRGEEIKKAVAEALEKAP